MTADQIQPSVDMKISMVTALKDETPNGARMVYLALIKSVQMYDIDAYGNKTVAIYSDPIFYDLLTGKTVDPASISDVKEFRISAIGQQILSITEAKNEAEAKVETLDAMVKQLTIKGDPRVIELEHRLRFAQNATTEARDETRQVRLELDNSREDNKLFAKTMRANEREINELKDKVKKLNNDLLNTANERDNKVEELANEKLPNLNRQVTFYEKRCRDLVEENTNLKADVEARKQQIKDQEIVSEREIRKLEKKLHKAGGVNRYLTKLATDRLQAASRAEAALKVTKTTLDMALSKIDDLKAHIRGLEGDDDFLSRDKEPAGPEMPHTMASGANAQATHITINIAGLTINELNTYA